MMNESSTIYRSETKTLLLAFLTGICLNGSLTAIFSSVIEFSIFPIIALVLAVNWLRKRYLESPVMPGIPLLTGACFLLGYLTYSAVIRASYPVLGANFLISLLCMVLLFWIGYRLKQLKKYATSELD